MNLKNIQTIDVFQNSSMSAFIQDYFNCILSVYIMRRDFHYHIMIVSHVIQIVIKCFIMHMDNIAVPSLTTRSCARSC